MTDDELTPDGTTPQQAKAAQIAALGLLASAMTEGGVIDAHDINLIMADFVPDGKTATAQDMAVLLAALIGVSTALLEHLVDDPLALVRRLILQAQL